MTEMELFLDFAKGGQRKFLLRLKKEAGVTWREMSRIFEVNRSMVFFYLDESSKLPYKRVLLLRKKKGISLAGYNLKKIERPGNKTIEIKKPKLTKKLAEFLGILAGDGCVCETNSEISVTCSALVDKNYAEKHVGKLFARLFGVKPTILIRGTGITCRIYSKKLKEFLAKKQGFPVGNRKNRTFIPKRIRKNKKLLSCYLRGLFDTDGSVYGRRKNSIVINYTSYSGKFLEQIKKSLMALGFSPCLSGNSIFIYNQKQADLFFKKIKPKNLKHIAKYKIFKKTGAVPSYQESIELMRP